MNVIKAKCGFKIGVVISICKPNDGFWSEAKIKTPVVLCYARGSSLMSWKSGNGLSKVHSLVPHNRNAIWLISWEGHVKNILLQPIPKMEV
jgi:hypothetical protein